MKNDFVGGLLSAKGAFSRREIRYVGTCLSTAIEPTQLRNNNFSSRKKVRNQQNLKRYEKSTKHFTSNDHIEVCASQLRFISIIVKLSYFSVQLRTNVCTSDFDFVQVIQIKQREGMENDINKNQRTMERKRNHKAHKASKKSSRSSPFQGDKQTNNKKTTQ